MKRALACALAVLFVALVAVSADVKTQEKSQIQFPGMLGKVFNLFGGKSAKEGVTSTVAVSGDRMIRTTDNSAELIDLREEKLYDIDLRNKSYKVTTFEEIRKQMREAEAKAKEEAKKEEGRSGDKPEKEYEVDVDVKPTGQHKTINTYDCREVIMTITVREKGKTLEQAGGLVMTADSWLAPTIPQVKEIEDFNIRYARALMGPDAVAQADKMAAALAVYPGLKAAFSKMQAQKGTMDGTPLETNVTVQNVKTAEQVAQEQKSEEQPKEQPTSMGGMLGGLGRRIAKPKKQDDQASVDKTRSTIMTTNHQVLSVSTNVSPAEVAIPAGFKQK
jgi:hypothetical protein